MSEDGAGPAVDTHASSRASKEDGSSGASGEAPIHLGASGTSFAISELKLDGEVEAAIAAVSVPCVCVCVARDPRAIHVHCVWAGHRPLFTWWYGHFREEYGSACNDGVPEELCLPFQSLTRYPCGSWCRSFPLTIRWMIPTLIRSTTSTPSFLTSRSVRSQPRPPTPYLSLSFSTPPPPPGAQHTAHP
jgi:hypothetical protein